MMLETFCERQCLQEKKQLMFHQSLKNDNKLHRRCGGMGRAKGIFPIMRGQDYSDDLIVNRSMKEVREIKSK